MYFVGLDLAWVAGNQTGVAVLDDDGRLVHVGVAVTDDEIATAVGPYVDGPCIVAIDAPIIVKNEEGFRPGETLHNRDFAPFDAIAQPSNRNNPLFDPPRAEVLASRLGLDPDPQSRSDRRAIEVYPHAATVSLFELDKILKFKRRNKDVATRQSELLRLVELIEGLNDATPRLRVGSSASWLELRKRVEAAGRAFQLNACEDPIDAVLCAYVALYWYHRPDDVTIYGDVDTGYILTPSLPQSLAPAPRRRVVAPPNDELHERLSHLEDLLAQAQLEAKTIRERLYRL